MKADRSATPKTLQQAHDFLMRTMPRRHEPPQVWLEFRRNAAKIYFEIAEIDRFHHHEALYWANWEEAKAAECAALIAEADRR